jgi:hypothetical protein
MLRLLASTSTHHCASLHSSAQMPSEQRKFAVVLDIGANMGAFSLYAASLGATIHSFEMQEYVQRFVNDTISRFSECMNHSRYICCDHVQVSCRLMGCLVLAFFACATSSHDRYCNKFMLLGAHDGIIGQTSECVAVVTCARPRLLCAGCLSYHGE